MKKGASHVDWAISMGIFLVFIMLTLTFLRPGTEPIYNGDALLKIVENGLKEESYYTVEKQLLSIDSDFSCTAEPCKIRIREASKKGLNPDWVDTSDVRKYTAVMNSSNDYSTKWDVYNEYCVGDPCGGYYPEIPYDKYVLDFESYLESGENTFYIIHNNNFTYETYGEGIENVDIDMKDDPTDATDWCSKCMLDEYNFTYKFGVSETSKGFSEEKLNTLQSKVYTDLKELWGLPEGVQFMINITNLSSQKVDYAFGTEEEPPEQSNVFVREWNDWMLQGDATLIPVKTRVKIWLGITTEPITPTPPPPGPTPPGGEEINMTGNMLLFHLDEASGTVIKDASGNGRDGIYNGALHNQPGVLDSAIGFDGTNDNIDLLSYVDDFYSGNEVGTVMSWVNVKDNSWGLLTMYHWPSACRLDFEVHTDYMRIFLWNENVEAKTNTLSLSGWHHVAFTQDGISAKIFLDGVEQTLAVNTLGGNWFNDVPCIYTVWVYPIAVYVGYNIDGSFNGAMDEFSIWNRSLSADEVKNVYDRQKGDL